MPSYLRNQTIGDALEHNAATRPGGEALIYPGTGRRYTWAQLNDETDRLARGLMALGVSKGDKIAVWATNVPEWLNTFYAAAKIGAIVVTVNTHYRKAEIEYLLNQSEADYLVLMESFRGYSYLEALREIMPALPRLKKVIFMGEAPQEGLYNYAEILKMAAHTPEAELVRVKKSQHFDDIINIQYTSGTTGFPKGVMLTHQNIVTNGYWIGERQNLTENDRICMPVPLFHCFGLVLAAMAALGHGASMVILNIYSALDILAQVAREKCTAIYGVPTMFISLLEQKSFDTFDLGSLRTGIMAGSPCPVKTMREVIERMNAREITICYGLTETSPVLAQTAKSDTLAKRTETVGKTLPGVEVRIVHPETGEEEPQGEVGEIVARGYMLMKGYYNMPEATAEIIDAEGWLHTGDLGKIDGDGYLCVTGRKKDMIIRAGENIYPQEVEEYLRFMPGVVDVQVVGVPSKLHGEEQAAFILADAGHGHISAKEVKAYLRPRISGYKIPRYVKVLEKFPMTASGKIQKYKLREMAAELWPKI